MAIYSLNGLEPNLPANGRFWIAPDAHVIGHVNLAEEVGIWFGAVLRGDNEPITIGARTNIQEGVLMHTDMGFPLTLGADCTIGHHAVLHGCQIGDKVVIGMGATVLNGSRIGANSLVGAGALVTEGKTFESGMLILGSPAKAVRALTPSEIDRIDASSRAYVANWQRFERHLCRLNDDRASTY